MGIEQIGKIISYASKVQVSKCAKFASSPAPFLEGQFKLATEVFGDTCHFSQVDRSLNPDFLRGLLKIEGKTPLEMCTKIKDEIVRAMGFKHPEILTLKETQGTNIYSYSFIDASVNISNSKVSKAKKIRLLRHELEHMLQSVKLYKSKGKNGYVQAVHNYLKNIGFKCSLEEVEHMINTEFYETMAKEVSVSAADGEKYFKALSEYTPICVTYSGNYKYVNNTLEKEAFAIEKKVLRILGENDTLLPDTIANYKTIIQLFEKKGIPSAQHEMFLQDLAAVAQLKGIETPENIRKFMKINRDFINGVEIAPKEVDFALECAQKIMSNEKQTETALFQVEAWLREGKYTAEDVLRSI